MLNAMDTLIRLQSWYSARCNEDWEHGSGVKIETIDNPGWRVSIDLSGTDQEDCVVEGLKLEHSEKDWVHAWKANGKLEGACGSESLKEHFLNILNA
jgi:Immunity protein 53